ncbi:MAG: Zn-dependent hydrolase, partial [Colwellia sp.]|nr:Zn-dependent hydrolase [Colwellia sp.]
MKALKLTKIAAVILFATTALSACNNTSETSANVQAKQVSQPELLPGFEHRLDIYKEVTLTADLSHLSAKQKQMLALLIDASKIMDDLFWLQAFSQDKQSFLASISDEKVRRF